MVSFMLKCLYKNQEVRYKLQLFLMNIKSATTESEVKVSITNLKLAFTLE